MKGGEGAAQSGPFPRSPCKRAFACRSSALMGIEQASSCRDGQPVLHALSGLKRRGRFPGPGILVSLAEQSHSASIEPATPKPDRLRAPPPDGRRTAGFQRARAGKFCT
jgi:hypothetical protein